MNILIDKGPIDSDPRKDEEIIQEKALCLAKSLQDVIEYLYNEREIRNGVSNKSALQGFLRGKLNELKNPESQLRVISSIQNQMFERILGNYQTTVDEDGAYKMR